MTTGMADSAYQDSKYYDIITSLTRQVLASPTLVLYNFPPCLKKPCEHRNDVGNKKRLCLIFGNRVDEKGGWLEVDHRG